MVKKSSPVRSNKSRRQKANIFVLNYLNIYKCKTEIKPEIGALSRLREY